MQTFEHGGRVWLCKAEGRGTRKRAAALAVLTRGTGQVRVCGREEVYVRWAYVYNRMEVLQPLYIAGAAGLFDVDLQVRGGGPSGQAAAARLAIGRALVAACNECQPQLEEGRPHAPQSSSPAAAAAVAAVLGVKGSVAAGGDLNVVARSMVLYEDTRQRMPKMPGRMKARKQRHAALPTAEAGCLRRQQQQREGQRSSSSSSSSTSSSNSSSENLGRNWVLVAGACMRAPQPHQRSPARSSGSGGSSERSHSSSITSAGSQAVGREQQDIAAAGIVRLQRRRHLVFSGDSCYLPPLSLLLLHLSTARSDPERLWAEEQLAAAAVAAAAVWLEASLLSPLLMTAALLPRRAAVSLSVSPGAVSFDAATTAATPAVSSAEALNEASPASLSPSQLSPRSPICSKHWRYSPALLRPSPPTENVRSGSLDQQDKQDSTPLALPPSFAEHHLDDQLQAPHRQQGDSPIAVGVYLAGYLLASPLLSLCNKRLYGGPAKNLGLTCCLLQQLILCCCLLLCNSQPQQPLKPQLQQQQELQQQQKQKRGVRRQETGTAPVSVSFRQQLQLACPYVLMLWSSNACLAVSSLASYQIARCSSIPIALLLEVLAVSACDPSPSPAAAAAAAAAKGGLPLLQRVGETLRALRTRAAAVGGLRAFSALAVAAGLAAAAADGDSLQPHAAFLGVAASAAGAIYLQLASSCFRIRAQAPAAAAATPVAAAAAAAAAAASPAKAAVPDGFRAGAAAAAGGDVRGRQEIAVAQRVALLSILLLLPVVAVSQEPQQLLLRLQQQQQQQQGVVRSSDLLLLVVSGCLAALLPLCTYGCLRGLSPLACCVAGFTKMAAQMLLSPWLAQETLSVSTAAGCCCCLVGSLAFCLSSHRRQTAKHEKQHKQR
ncbi:hypothetical protein Emed_005886 [Eimeria media]